ncbi:hypothetical protein BURMUCGD1_4660 [Burkholderia multivorans CGD1]|nr:hypothetical protein BURMUCGD1_4660 [Burkholderia multivorans CGD1]
MSACGSVREWPRAVKSGDVGGVHRPRLLARLRPVARRRHTSGLARTALTRSETVPFD